MSTKNITDSLVCEALHKHRTNQRVEEVLDLIGLGYSVKAALFKKFLQLAAMGHGVDVMDAYIKTANTALKAAEALKLNEARQCPHCRELTSYVFVCPVCSAESCLNCTPDGKCPYCEE